MDRTKYPPKKQKKKAHTQILMKELEKTVWKQ